MNKLILSKYVGEIIALFSGIILTFAFAPFRIFPLGIISPALFLIALLNLTPKRALLRGWLFGVGLLGSGVYWVFISLRVYGYSSIFFATLTTIILIAAFAFYYGVQGYLLARFFPKTTISKCLLVFPTLWVLSEWIRSWLFTGFPWLSLGYSQITSPLKGLAPIFGIYGISFASVFTSGALVALIYFYKTINKTIIISSILLLWIISYVLFYVPWTHPLPKNMSVALVQGNIPQQQKWKPEQIDNILQTYWRLTQKAWRNQIIIWPEAAIIITDRDAKSYLEMVNEAAIKHKAAILTGIPIYKNFQFFNGMIALGEGQGYYLKRHLLPFGDYIPLRLLFSVFSAFVQIPMSDFTHGPEQQPVLTAQNIPIAAFICYEIVFPEEVIKSLPAAQLLVLITDDSWFGKSIASAQHLEMGQMRALETGRYLLFCSNSGITAIINPKGNLQATAPEFEEYILTGTIQPMVGTTPFVLWGNYPVILLPLFGLIFLLYKNRKKSQ